MASARVLLSQTAALSAVLYALLVTPAGAGADTTIGVYDFYYEPPALAVEQGTEVTWQWEEGIHDVVSVDGSFASEVGTGLVFRHTFERPGIYYYYCTVHAQPSQANEEGIANGFMVGKVVVEGAEAGIWELVVSDQALPEGSTSVTIDSVTLEAPGYVALYGDDGGAVANSRLLGVSPLLEAGSHQDVAIELEAPLSAERLAWARLHTEDSGNAGFDGAAEDLAVHDPESGNNQFGDVVAWPMTLSVEGQGGLEIDLFEGWNLVSPWEGPYIGDEAVSEYFDANVEGEWDAVAYYDGEEWLQRFEDPPLPSFNTLDEIIPGWAIWLFVPLDGQLVIVP